MVNIFTSFRNSLILSVILQLTAGLITIYTLFIPIHEEYSYLYSLTGMDTIVQFIEALFYILFIYLGVSAPQASKIRYFDWFITTPIMILTTIAFFFYDSNEGKQFSRTKINKTTREQEKSFIKNKLFKPMKDFIKYKDHYNSIIIILLSNFLMLLTGYLGEINILSIISATIIGFLFFFVEFYYIYKDFVIPYGNSNTYLYYSIFIIVWGLYGVAYVFNDTIKNISYNILDLISKNIYGLLLGLSIYNMRI